MLSPKRKRGFILEPVLIKYKAVQREKHKGTRNTLLRKLDAVNCIPRRASPINRQGKPFTTAVLDSNKTYTKAINTSTHSSLKTSHSHSIPSMCQTR